MNIVLTTRQFIPKSANISVIGNSLGYDLTLKNGKYYNLATRTLIEGLGPCAKLSMWAGKCKYEANTAPELEPLNSVAQNISSIVEGLRSRLKNSFEEVHAFITGGIEYSSENPISKKSIDLLEEMYESLYKEGVPTSVIAGQRGNGLKTRIDSVSYKDNIFLCGKPVDNVLASKKELKEALNEHFDFVEIGNMPIEIKR